MRRLSLEISLRGTPVERFDNLVFDADQVRDFFATINRDSTLVVAVDPDLMTDLPAADAGMVAFADSSAQPATGRLVAGADTLINVTAAQPGARANRTSLLVAEGHAARVFAGAAAAPSIGVFARNAGRRRHRHLVRHHRRCCIGGGAGAGHAGQRGSYGGAGQYWTAWPRWWWRWLRTPRCGWVRLGDVLPEATAGRLALVRTVSVTVAAEGSDTTELADLDSATAITAALDALPQIVAVLAPGADGTRLPSAGVANDRLRAGGRDAGPAQAYAGQETQPPQ